MRKFRLNSIDGVVLIIIIAGFLAVIFNKQLESLLDMIIESGLL
jgi:hypothetical protein